MTNNTNQGPVEGGLPSLSLFPPWVSDGGGDSPLFQWMACMPILMASPCSPLDLFLEGINFMDPIALDGGEATKRRETPTELPWLPRILRDLEQKWSILRLNISVLNRATQAIAVLI